MPIVLRDLAAVERGVRGHALGERGEVAAVERLRAVAERDLRVLVDLDEDPVGADRGGGAGERLDQAAIARRVAGIDSRGVLHRDPRPSAERLQPSGVVTLRAIWRGHDHGLGSASCGHGTLGNEYGVHGTG